MSRPVTFGRPAPQELHTGTIHTALADGTTTYVLDDQPTKVRGPATYLRAAVVADADDPNTPAVPPQGTTCLVVTPKGSWSAALVIPFQ